MAERSFLQMMADLAVELRSTQWSHRPDFTVVSGLPVMSRDDLRSIPQAKGRWTARTSGSTGEPVSVEKTNEDFMWHTAANARDVEWRGWDTSLNMAVIRGDQQGKPDRLGWSLPPQVFPRQGKTFVYHFAPISEIQDWLERKNPHYIFCPPTIFSQIDTARLPNFKSWRGTGEAGGTMYSSEECGVIALRCPDHPSNYHVMENQIVEVEDTGAALITTLTNPYIRRYRHGDHLELGRCSCGRSLQTITKINGRVRNMFITPDGDRRWPVFGSRTMHERYGVKRFRAVQRSLDLVELQIIAPDLTPEQRQSLAGEVKTGLGCDIRVEIRHVGSLPDYKFEEFVCELPKKDSFSPKSRTLGEG